MPLAHILAPQIAKKAQEIETALGHAPVGYLEQQNVGYEKTPYDPRGLTDKPEPKRYDPRSPAGSALAMLGSMKKYDPKIAEGIVRGMQKAKVQEGVKPIPNAPVPAQPEPVTPTKGKRGRVVIPMGKPGEPVGVAEDGQAIDSRGRKLGYLNQGPALVTPYGDVPLSNPVRTPTGINVQPKDEFDAFWLEDHFGKHLKAMQDNRDANGMPTDQFPPGYFQGMSKKERENIIKGVDALRKFQKGTSV